MRFKQGMSLDDLNFGMENYSSLVNVKLLLDARVQNSTCTTYEKCTLMYIIAVLTPKSVIQLTAFMAFETGRKLNSACCNYVHFSHQQLISVAQKRSFPKSTEQ